MKRAVPRSGVGGKPAVPLICRARLANNLEMQRIDGSERSSRRSETGRDAEPVAPGNGTERTLCPSPGVQQLHRSRSLLLRASRGSIGPCLAARLPNCTNTPERGRGRAGQEQPARADVCGRSSTGARPINPATVGCTVSCVGSGLFFPDGRRNVLCRALLQRGLGQGESHASTRAAETHFIVTPLNPHSSRVLFH